ncbi:hypothetical protein ELI_1774 [Eubacterium callanderi]|uniref:Uncharacterized protein n=1 Tax=Eubacterium callanderi TaxID=53442 RepID=E3GDF5_9FIRM|nr:hypothetical protein ELI_1774 [Eubacterium callanderi]
MWISLYNNDYQTEKTEELSFLLLASKRLLYFSRNLDISLFKGYPIKL